MSTITLKEAFGENGLALKKEIRLFLSLQKGKEDSTPLSSFDLRVNGCCNIARKLLFLLSSVILAIVLKMIFKKNCSF